MKLCIDCKWFDGADGSSCRNPALMVTDPVRGPLPGFPDTLREDGGKCGTEASGWEQRKSFWQRLFPLPTPEPSHD